MLFWEKICKLKSEGGFGIRLVREMNIVLLVKLGWRLLNTKDGFWVNIMRKKFRVGEVEDVSWLEIKGTWLSIWRSLVMGLREVVVSGMVWVFGDGFRIRFWKDNWLVNEFLVMLSMVDILEEKMEVRVREVW